MEIIFEHIYTLLAIVSTVLFTAASFCLIRKFQKKRKNIYRSSAKKDLLKIATRITHKLRVNDKLLSNEEIFQIEKNINKCVKNLDFKELLNIYCTFFPEEEIYIKKYYRK